MDHDSDNDLPETSGKLKNKGQSIKLVDIDIAYTSLKKYLDIPELTPLFSALDALKSGPQNEVFQEQVIKAFSELGVYQGAALTYAPYLNIFVSDDPFGD